RTTRDEARACTARGYAAIDTGSKGSIGYIQFSDWSERWLGDRNALPSPFETDSDSDDRITLAELKAQLDKTFTRLDRNKDGVLVRSELLTIDSTRGLGGASDRGPRGKRPRP
ncbi:MAG: EF-hand domain-containing protein, partial [Sphingomonas sp.]|nr:EF-hand domain-containing protein [Sphingomonas sp.]